jgi:uncharacterized protein (DUF885 family)
MITRRSVLLACTAAALARPSAAEDSQSGRLHDVFDALADQTLRRSPELATAFGLDRGKYAALKSKWSDLSLAAQEENQRIRKRQLADLRAIDRGALRGRDISSFDTVMFTQQLSVQGDETIPYNGGSLSSPYVLSQLVGAYRDAPDFLDTQHSIATRDDADAYVARLEGLAVVLGQELDQLKRDVAAGVVPPDFVLERTLGQMKAFSDTPAEKATLVVSLASRAKAAGIAGDWQARAAKIYTDKIVPGVRAQAAALQALQPKAVHAAGVARLPKGDAYYALSLRNYTTSSMAPAEIHATGLTLVDDLSGQIDSALKAQGLRTGSVAERLRALAADPKQLYADTDDAKVQLIADLNRKVAAVQAKLPAYFGALPKTGVEIHRVPKAIEAGAPGGYYQPGSLDGSRKGIYWINLRDTSETPRYRLPTLTYHESIPGHHLQLTLAQEMKDLPLIRKMVFFSGYGEGWALYAEQLAVEMGMYADDPLGHVGQLQDALFRAVRLVVDTGLHSEGWSREKAIDYFAGTLGVKRSEAQTEVERYCVWPGQACSYMVGKLTWLRVRDRARRALGAKFDLRKFHDAGLLSGALPLDVLEQVIGTYIATAKA